MIYFDNNATTRPAPQAAEAMAEFLSGEFGNPSSAHGAGLRARRAVEEARETVAGLLGAGAADGIVFTSGGTESDNWAILGALEANPEKRHIVTTRVEHEAVRKLCEKLETKGYDVTWLDVDESGSLDLDRLRSALTRQTAIVSVMMANNETGVMFPVAEIAEIVKENSDALFHADGVNAAGKAAIDLKGTAIDLFSISGHKFHGPKGIGALYFRSGVHLPAMFIGGGQEKGRRAGTEAVHQIAGLGAAARFASDLSPMDVVRRMRDELEKGILSAVPGSFLIGGDAAMRLANTSNICFEGLNGEMILHRLNEAGVCVSTGSACNSESRTGSPVLLAMNVPYSRAMGSIRFSLGRFNTETEVAEVIRLLLPITEELRRMSR